MSRLRLTLMTLTLAAMLMAPPAEAVPKRLKGKPIVVLMRGASNDANIYIWGKCTGMDEQGLWLDQTHIQFMPNPSKERKEKDVYIPWSSTTLVKPDRS